MTLESLVIWIIVGGIAGLLAEAVVRGVGVGLVGAILVGILGAVIGGWLFGLLGIAVGGLLGEILVAFVGAVILLLIARASHLSAIATPSLDELAPSAAPARARRPAPNASPPAYTARGRIPQADPQQSQAARCQRSAQAR